MSRRGITQGVICSGIATGAALERYANREARDRFGVIEFHPTEATLNTHLNGRTVVTEQVNGHVSTERQLVEVTRHVAAHCHEGNPLHGSSESCCERVVLSGVIIESAGPLRPKKEDCSSGITHRQCLDGVVKQLPHDRGRNQQRHDPREGRYKFVLGHVTSFDHEGGKCVILFPGARANTSRALGKTRAL